MQQCQDLLDFSIETPSDTELAKRFTEQSLSYAERTAKKFAERQKFLSELVPEPSTYQKQQNQMKTKANLEDEK